MSEGKPKIALYWCASCGGCEEAVVDLAEDLLKITEKVDIVFWPVAIDAKKEDLEKLRDGEILVSFINGAIRLSEHEEMVKLLRRKSKLIVAYGSCSYMGGIPSLANLYPREEILRYVAMEAPTVENPDKTTFKEKAMINGVELELPRFLEKARPLDEIVEVDYYIPGCPPTPQVTLKAIETLLSGNLPPRGSVIGASDKSLCNECPLNSTKPEKLLVKKYKRLAHAEIDPEKCLLAQGIPCLGPVTRGGCNALCIKAGMPCTGCFGPLDGVVDYGGKAVSYLASILDVPPEKDAVLKALEGLPDPVGYLYKYSLAKSLLFRKRAER